jgi:NB-ARC domain
VSRKTGIVVLIVVAAAVCAFVIVVAIHGGTAEAGVYAGIAAALATVVSTVLAFASLFRPSSEAARRRMAKRQISNLPTPNPHFVDDMNRINDLRKKIKKADLPAVCAIRGMGGIGKTQLALAYAHHYLGRYKIVWWLDATSLASIATGMTSLAERLELSVSSQHEIEIVETVREELSAGRRWLLVFDNASDQAVVRRFLPSGRGHVLISSRSLDWGGLGESFDCKAITPNEAINFLRGRTGRDEPAAAGELAEKCGYLPLALAQAGGYIASRDISVTECLERYKREAGNFFDRALPPSDYPEGITTTWRLQFQGFAESCRPAIGLLRLYSFLDPAAIPETALDDLDQRDLLSFPILTELADSDEVHRGIDTLIATSLLTRADAGAVRIHPLLQDVIRFDLTEEDRRNWCQAVVGILNKRVSVDCSDSNESMHCARWLPHVFTAFGHAADSGLPRAELTLLASRVGGQLGLEIVSQRVRTPGSSPAFHQSEPVVVTTDFELVGNFAPFYAGFLKFKLSYYLEAIGPGPEKGFSISLLTQPDKLHYSVDTDLSSLTSTPGVYRITTIVNASPEKGEQLPLFSFYEGPVIEIV